MPESGPDRCGCADRSISWDRKDPPVRSGRSASEARSKIPAAVGPDEIEVSAPFTMTGSLAYGQGADGFPIVESMRGAGTATLTFRLSPFDPSAWQFVRAAYVFESLARLAPSAGRA